MALPWDPVCHLFRISVDLIEHFKMGKVNIFLIYKV